MVYVSRVTETIGLQKPFASRKHAKGYCLSRHVDHLQLFFFLIIHTTAIEFNIMQIPKFN